VFQAGRVVQTVTIVAQDYTRFVEEQIKQANQPQLVQSKKDDIADEIMVD